MPSRAPTAYGLAIATQQVDVVARHIPAADQLLPEHRQALFKLGHAHLIEHLVGETPQSLERQHRDRAQAMYGVTPWLGGTGLTQHALLLATLGAPVTHAAHTGGFTTHDYFFANRHCDLDYARYLRSRQLLPEPAHAAHLLSVLGRAQYGEQKQFSFADDALGRPLDDQLPGCAALATLYGEQVRLHSRR